MLFSSYSILKEYLMSEFSFASFIETNCFHFSRRFKKIREQVDYVYRHLQHLCDILEENDSDEVHDMNSDSIRIDESNELLDGMKELFKKSTYEEQVRLMTIAPDSWGRTAIAQWFGATDHQALAIHFTPVEIEVFWHFRNILVGINSSMKLQFNLWYNFTCRMV